MLAGPKLVRDLLASKSRTSRACVVVYPILPITDVTTAPAVYDQRAVTATTRRVLSTSMSAHVTSTSATSATPATAAASDRPTVTTATTLPVPSTATDPGATATERTWGFPAGVAIIRVSGRRRASVTTPRVRGTCMTDHATSPGGRLGSLTDRVLTGPARLTDIAITTALTNARKKIVSGRKPDRP